MRRDIITWFLLIPFCAFAQIQVVPAVLLNQTDSDPILSLNLGFALMPDTIDSDAVNDGDTISGSNVWTDASGNGHDASIGAGTYELDIVNGVRNIRWTSTGWLDMPSDASLDVVPGTDEFTLIWRVGVRNPDNGGYAISKAPSTTGDRTGAFYNAFGQFGGVYVGGTNISPSPATYPENGLIILIVSTTVANMWVDGTQVITNQSIGTGDPGSQSWNIGSRTDGGFQVNSPYSMSIAALALEAITTQERQDIEATYQIN